MTKKAFPYKLNLGVLLIFLGLIFLATNSEANSNAQCNQQLVDTELFAVASENSVKLLNKLNDSKGDLAIISRVGSDISSKGLKYTHAGIVWRDTVSSKWQISHVLNDCEADTAKFYQHGLLDFFLTDLFSNDILVTVPVPELQAGLIDLLAKEDAMKVFSPKYSMIAYPWQTEIQNSNQWILEVIAMAQGSLEGQKIRSRVEAQEYLKEKSFQGSVIRVWFFESLFGALFKENVSFSDHTEEERAAGKYEFVSVKSLVNYLSQTGVLEKNWELKD
ncbi:MAG: DUF2145 domain-containing protein [Proteobacteria bacterium]|nr:DUF2145 domain-containing protein [Pseudomonadota bacterium]